MFIELYTCCGLCCLCIDTNCSNQQKEKNPLFQKNLKGKVIFIRHGETNYNIDFSKKGAKIKGDIHYIDGHLNSTGERQAINSSKNFKLY